MLHCTVEFLEDDRVVLLTMLPGFTVKEGGDVLQAVYDEFERIDQMAYYLADIRQINLGFGDLVIGMADSALGKRPVLAHPNTVETIVISESEIVKMGINALGQAQYGSAKARVARDLDEALAYVRSNPLD